MKGAVVLDATSADAHVANAAALADFTVTLVDLAPAALGAYVVPAVNLDEPDANMVTCGGQATIPDIAAFSRVTEVAHAEIVASIASKSAGPDGRADIDDFTEATSRALGAVGAPGATSRRPKRKVSVFLEVEGGAHHLPAYAGNLEIMTSAGLRTAEATVARKALARVGAR